MPPPHHSKQSKKRQYEVKSYNDNDNDNDNEINLFRHKQTHHC